MIKITPAFGQTVTQNLCHHWFGYSKFVALKPSSTNGAWPLKYTIKQICNQWGVEVSWQPRLGRKKTKNFPVSRPIPLVSIQLHCLPSSNFATKAKSHPSEVGVRPHLPTSEFVCVDELWTYSAGMLFCGDYKDPYSDCEASTELSHNNYFVSQRLSGGGSWHSKHPSFPTATHTPTL